MTRKRNYASPTETICRARGSHSDATALVEHLYNNGGKSDETTEELAIILGWEKRIGSARVVDMGRFDRAKNHVKDGTTRSGDPCTGFRLHYRTSAKDNEWMLVDPSGGIAHHREVARAEILGDIQQQVGFRTVNGRRIATAQKMADFCLAVGDVYGYQLMSAYAMELERFGAASDTSIANLTAYFA